MAAILLDIPYIQAVGGVLLLSVAYKLLKPHDEHANAQEAGSLREAVQTIVLADVVMSPDNMLAVGAASDGHRWLLLFGLLLSIPVLLLGSGLAARLLTNYPILVYVGATILIWTAVEMLLEDPIIHDNVRAFSALESLALSAVVAAILIGCGLRAQRLLSRSRCAEEDSLAEQVIEATEEQEARERADRRLGGAENPGTAAGRQNPTNRLGTDLWLW